MENNTDWQRPVTAEGKLDVRVGDVWTVKAGPPSSGEVLVPPRGGDVCMWTGDRYGMQVTTIHDLGALLSRNGTPWDVPGDKRTGRWLKYSDVPIYTESPRLCPGNDYTIHGMVWLPISEPVATPEPVRMDAPPAGERWEHGGLVYLPITVTSGGEAMTFRRHARSGLELLHMAAIAPDFVGYYYPAHNGKAAAVRSDHLRYRNPRTGKCGPRCSPGDEIVRPSHVVMKGGA